MNASLLEVALEMAQGLFEAGIIDDKEMEYFHKECAEPPESQNERSK